MSDVGCQMYQPINLSTHQPTDLRLRIADFATNKPIKQQICDCRLQIADFATNKLTNQ
jgi:hypothetical protein